MSNRRISKRIQSKLDNWNIYSSCNMYEYLANIYADYYSNKNMNYEARPKKYAEYNEYLNQEVKRTLDTKTYKDMSNLIFSFYKLKNNGDYSHINRTNFLVYSLEKSELKDRIDFIFRVWNGDRCKKNNLKKLFLYKYIVMIINELNDNLECLQDTKDYIVNIRKQLLNVLLYNVEINEFSSGEKDQYDSFCSKVEDCKEKLPVKDDLFLRKCFDFKLYNDFEKELYIDYDSYKYNRMKLERWDENIIREYDDESSESDEE